MLDEAGLQRLKIVASGGLNEARVDALAKARAPIDIFGVGTEMSVAADAPALETVAARSSSIPLAASSNGCIRAHS